MEQAVSASEQVSNKEYRRVLPAPHEYAKQPEEHLTGNHPRRLRQAPQDKQNERRANPGKKSYI
jgi:hypothetical protein